MELGVALDHANAANAESHRNLQRLQTNIREINAKYEEESRAKAAAQVSDATLSTIELATATQDNLIAADRRANANKNALEEGRTLLEQADRTRRMLEQELADTNEALSEQTCINQAIRWVSYIAPLHTSHSSAAAPRPSVSRRWRR